MQYWILRHFYNVTFFVLFKLLVRVFLLSLQKVQKYQNNKFSAGIHYGYDKIIFFIVFKMVIKVENYIFPSFLCQKLFSLNLRISIVDFWRKISSKNKAKWNQKQLKKKLKMPINNKVWSKVCTYFWHLIMKLLKSLHCRKTWPQVLVISPSNRPIGNSNSHPNDLELGALTKWLDSQMLVWVSSGFSTAPWCTLKCPMSRIQ